MTKNNKVEDLINKWGVVHNCSQIAVDEHNFLLIFAAHHYQKLTNKKSAQASGSLDTETKFQGIAQWLTD